MERFFKPTKLTWWILIFFVVVIILNGITLNMFNVGFELFFAIPYYLPIAISIMLGINIGHSDGWGFFFNPFGWPFIIIFDLATLFIISSLFAKIIQKIKNSFQKSIIQ